MEEGFVTEARLQYALGFQRQQREMKLGEVLQEMGVISQEQLDDALRIQMETMAQD